MVFPFKIPHSSYKKWFLSSQVKESLWSLFRSEALCIFGRIQSQTSFNFDKLGKSASFFPTHKDSVYEIDVRNGSSSFQLLPDRCSIHFSDSILHYQLLSRQLRLRRSFLWKILKQEHELFHDHRTFIYFLSSCIYKRQLLIQQDLRILPKYRWLLAN